MLVLTLSLIQSKKQAAVPSEFLAEIDKNFGSLQEFETSVICEVWPSTSYLTRSIQFTNHALGVFGSGSVWLVQNEDGALRILTTFNAGNPLALPSLSFVDLNVENSPIHEQYRSPLANVFDGRARSRPAVLFSPLLVLDLWEHSYLTDYGVDRQTYIGNFFKVIDWDRVSRIYVEKRPEKPLPPASAEQAPMSQSSDVAHPHAGHRGPPQDRRGQDDRRGNDERRGGDDRRGPQGGFRRRNNPWGRR